MERKHPCLRGGGSCRKGEDCDYVTFPYEACLPYLQGKCPRSPCPDLHMDEVPPPSLPPRLAPKEQGTDTAHPPVSTALFGWAHRPRQCSVVAVVVPAVDP